MTAVPPALPGTAQNKRLKESHEFTRLLLGKADIRVVKIKQKIPVANPHPPSLPAGSPLSRDAGEGLCGCTSSSPAPVLRERVPSAARRVRVSRYQVLDPY